MLILVASCAGYADAWEPFATLFNKFWPDCPYHRYLISERPAGNEVMTGFEFTPQPDHGWINNLRNMLLAFKDETVLVFQEDFFICYPADSQLVERLDVFVKNSKYDGLRLFPCPGADDETEIIPGVGLITPGAPYRVSCQLMIWKRKSLLTLCDRLLQAGCTRIQEFETRGSGLINDFKLCGWIRKDHPKTWPISYLCSAIANGRWMQGAVQLCAELGIPLSNRPIVFADDAQQAILQNSYYEWLEICATGTYPMRAVKLKS